MFMLFFAVLCGELARIGLCDRPGETARLLTLRISGGTLDAGELETDSEFIFYL
jgi:hypothetical protein